MYRFVNKNLGIVKRLFLYEKKRNLLRKIQKHESYKKSCKVMLTRILHWSKVPCKLHLKTTL
jgi:hypothetical protein